jgi:hypothetical protein
MYVFVVPVVVGCWYRHSFSSRASIATWLGPTKILPFRRCVLLVVRLGLWHFLSMHWPIDLRTAMSLKTDFVLHNAACFAALHVATPIRRLRWRRRPRKKRICCLPARTVAVLVLNCILLTMSIARVVAVLTTRPVVAVVDVVTMTPVVVVDGAVVGVVVGTGTAWAVN